MSKPQSIGDDNKSSKYSLVKETYPLPGSVGDVVSKFAEILNLGFVQKVLVQIGQPIIVERYSKAAKGVELPSPEELPEPEEDFLADARNGKMVVLGLVSEPYSALHLAFLMMSRNVAKPVVIYVHTMDSLCKWMNCNETEFSVFNKNELFGVEIRESPAMPEDSLLLVGKSEMDTFSVKVLMDLPKKGNT